MIGIMLNKIHIVNVYLPHCSIYESQPGRLGRNICENDLNSILDKMGKDDRVVVCGDMNDVYRSRDFDNQYSPTFRHSVVNMLDRGFVDIFALRGKCFTTVSGRFDYMLKTKNIKTYGGKVFESFFGSDHKPILSICSI